MLGQRFTIRLVAKLPFDNTTRTVRRGFASRIAIPITPPFPVIDACPSPTCPCRETPSGLDIEREQDINGSMAAYAEQVLVSTGKGDWTSRIEEDEDGELVRQLKGFLGPKGKYSNPFHNVLLTHSSFVPTQSPAHHVERPTSTTSTSPSIPKARSDKNPSIDPQHVPSLPTASAFLLPSFEYVPSIPLESSAVEDFIRAFLLPSQLHQAHDRLTRSEQNILLRKTDLQSSFPGARRAKEILILICSHQARDSRCGILGPLLQAEFEEKLQRQNIPILRDEPVAEAEEVNEAVTGYTPHARVGLISHIGGHKWAGNVIIYIPPEFRSNSLAGHGVWYGRVGPEHVEGIVEKTVLGGKVIKDLFRGGIDQDRKILRL